MRCIAIFAVMMLAITCLTSCSTTVQDIKTKEVLQRAQSQGWISSIIPAASPSAFQLFSLRNQTLPLSGVLNVYIEGDGHAWNQGTLSGDPTPLNPIGLELALAQGFGSVAYLARPCQYIGVPSNPKCTSSFWANKRYSNEVIQSLQGGLNYLKRATGATKIVLIGYSGGGTLALLLASQRSDVDKVVTVAGNLDIESWAAYHHLPPLSGSLNPVDVVIQNQGLVQYHFVGAKDEVVPPFIATDYSERYPEKNRPKVISIVENDHVCCWVTQWPILIRRTLEP